MAKGLHLVCGGAGGGQHSRFHRTYFPPPDLRGQIASHPSRFLCRRFFAGHAIVAIQSRRSGYVVPWDRGMKTKEVTTDSLDFDG